jgi:hypothetical protein
VYIHVYKRMCCPVFLKRENDVFTSVSFVFARRETNQEAHCCAKYAAIHEGSFSWDAKPPAFLAAAYRLIVTLC